MDFWAGGLRTLWIIAAMVLEIESLNINNVCSACWCFYFTLLQTSVTSLLGSEGSRYEGVSRVSCFWHTHTHTHERAGLLGAEEETLRLFCMFIYALWICLLQMLLVSSLLSVNVRSHPLGPGVCRRADRFWWWHLNKQVITYMQKQKGAGRNVVLAPGEHRWLYISLWFGGKSVLNNKVQIVFEQTTNTFQGSVWFCMLTVSYKKMSSREKRCRRCFSVSLRSNIV